VLPATHLSQRWSRSNKDQASDAAGDVWSRCGRMFSGRAFGEEFHASMSSVGKVFARSLQKQLYISCSIRQLALSDCERL
jgi:hypothetical protein